MYGYYFVEIEGQEFEYRGGVMFVRKFLVWYQDGFVDLVWIGVCDGNQLFVSYR